MNGSNEVAPHHTAKKKYRLKAFLAVTLLLAGVILIQYTSHEKLATLNLHFLPVLLAAYFIGARSAIAGGFLSILSVFFFVILNPEVFYMGHTRLGLFVHLASWACVLLGTGAIVGQLKNQIAEKVSRLRAALDDAQKDHERLQAVNLQLEDKNQALDAMKSKVESVLYSTMDPLVAKMVINQQLVNEKKEITVLFSDLVSFTATVENMQPEVVVNELNRLFSQMEPAITSFRGHLDKYIGDSLMAEFGIPVPSAHSAVEAVLAGLKMQQIIARRDFRWKMRVGIAHGSALVGLVGSQHRRNFTALGDTVNLASRLQDLCPVGSVCVDSATFERVKMFFNTQRLYTGWTPEEAESLTTRLRALQKMMRSGAGKEDSYLEAGKISSELGNVTQAIEYYRKALELNPSHREEIESCVAQAVLEESESSVNVKGKTNRVVAYEINSLRDPFEEAERIPGRFRSYLERWTIAEGLNREMLLPLEARDATLFHSQTTAALGCALAEALGLPEEAKRAVFLSGFFHDVGKRNVPEHLLNQPKRLMNMSEQDRSLVQSHVESARAVLADLKIKIPEEALVSIDQHHENMDGTGYPKGLKGEQISPAARILHIADAYDSLTSWRPYRDSWDPVAALNELRQDASAGRLDAKTTDVFCRLIQSGLNNPPPPKP